jgi:hypothetical protein
VIALLLYRKERVKISPNGLMDGRNTIFESVAKKDDAAQSLKTGNRVFYDRV